MDFQVYTIGYHRDPPLEMLGERRIVTPADYGEEGESEVTIAWFHLCDDGVVDRMKDRPNRLCG